MSAPWAYGLPIGGGGFALVCIDCREESEQEQAIDPPDEDRDAAIESLFPLFDRVRAINGEPTACEFCQRKVNATGVGFEPAPGESNV